MWLDGFQGSSRLNDRRYVFGALVELKFPYACPRRSLGPEDDQIPAEKDFKLDLISLVWVLSADSNVGAFHNQDMR